MKSGSLHIHNNLLENLVGKNVICLIDGQHHIDVIKRTVKRLLKNKINLKNLIFIGGSEKIRNLSKTLDIYENSINLLSSINKEKIDFGMLDKLFKKLKPDYILDLSDEPIIDFRTRFKTAAFCLQNKITYIGGDFYFIPPEEKEVFTKPSLKIIGTGKRIGKTAVGVAVSKILKENNYNPIVLCMGRGGPEEPEFINTSEVVLDENFLLKIADEGKHAASDYLEDAILAQVPTIGCTRCGGGMAGNAVYSNMLEGAKLAESLPYELVIAEGSGSTMPPLKTDKTITLIGADQPLWKIKGFFGQYRIMLADLIIVTMCEENLASEEKIMKIAKHLDIVNPNADKLYVKFRPQPSNNITGKKIFLCTTATDGIQDKLISSLEKNYSCQIIGYSNNLSDRDKLEKDLEFNLSKADILLTEVKAASIDVAAMEAKKIGKKIVFLHNKPVEIYKKNFEKSIVRLFNGK